MLLREVDRRIGLLDAMNEAIPDPRQSGETLLSWLLQELLLLALVRLPRPSNIDAAKHSRAITKLLVAAIRNRWPEMQITLRADSGFCTIRLKLFKVAVHVVTSVRRVVLHLSSSYRGFQQLWPRPLRSAWSPR